MALSREQPWKNKRKRSLYVEEGYAGFIYYRKSKTSRNEEDASNKLAALPPVVEQTYMNYTTEKPLEEKATGTYPLSEDMLERLVEVRSFIDQLKREIRAKRLDISEDKLEEVCGKIYDELRSDIISGSGLYIQYLEAEEEEDKLAPHPMDTQLLESIRQLKQKIELCEKETAEWETLLESKKRTAQASTQDLESNLSVDWRELGAEDEAKLVTHLSPEQRGWLDRTTIEIDDTQWENCTNDSIKTVKSNIDRELERIQAYCDSVLHNCALDTHKLTVGDTQPTQTPRTLFRALKDTD